jgi:hypothetical protein
MKDLFNIQEYCSHRHAIVEIEGLLMPATVLFLHQKNKKKKKKVGNIVHLFCQ